MTESKHHNNYQVHHPSNQTQKMAKSLTAMQFHVITQNFHQTNIYFILFAVEQARAQIL